MGCVKIFIFPKFALCGLRDFHPSYSVESTHYYNFWKERSCWLFGSAYLSSFLKVFSLELRSTLKWNSPFIIRFVSWFGFMSLHFRHLPNDGFWKWCLEKLNLMNPILTFFFFSQAVGGVFLFLSRGSVINKSSPSPCETCFCSHGLFCYILHPSGDRNFFLWCCFVHVLNSLVICA